MKKNALPSRNRTDQKSSCGRKNWERQGKKRSSLKRSWKMLQTNTNLNMPITIRRWNQRFYRPCLRHTRKLYAVYVVLIFPISRLNISLERCSIQLALIVMILLKETTRDQTILDVSMKNNVFCGNHTHHHLRYNHFLYMKFLSIMST